MDWRGVHSTTGGAAPPPAAAPPAALPAAMAASWYGGWPVGGAAYTSYAPSAYSVATSYATVAARSSQAFAQAQHLQQQQQQQKQSATASYNAAVRAQWPSASSTAASTSASAYVAPASAPSAKYASASAPLSFSSSSSPSAPSYAAIAARPPPSAPLPKSAPPKAAAPASAGWPPELRDYVERAFARARNDAEKTATEEQLKDVIQTAIHANLLWSRDWRNYPLPALSASAQPPPPPPPSIDPPPPPPLPSAAPHYSAPPSAASSYNPKVRPRIDPPPGNFVPLNMGAGVGALMRKEKKAKLQLDEPDSFKARRAERFAEQQQTPTKRRKAWKDPHHTTATAGSGGAGGGGGDDEAWAGLAIRGTSTELEKQYLRLTAPPDPATVRPLQVLRNALALVKRKWKANQDYAHACEQLKSIRQDLTVQAIKEEFSAEVYEVHARLALENRDLSEFNQCQTQIFELFLCGIRTPASLEFIAYRVLYFVYRSAQSDLARLLVLLEPAVRRQPAVAHALSVHRALLLDNYASFFRLYLSAPNMSAYLMDLFIDGMRRTALRVISKACRPSVPLAWLQTELAFEDLAECSEYVRQQGVSLSPDGTELLLK